MNSGVAWVIGAWGELQFPQKTTSKFDP